LPDSVTTKLQQRLHSELFQKTDLTAPDDRDRTLHIDRGEVGGSPTLGTQRAARWADQPASHSMPNLDSRFADAEVRAQILKLWVVKV